MSDACRLFAFICADRLSEREKIDSFIRGELQKDGPRVLWVNGEPGNGKSFLIHDELSGSKAKVAFVCNTEKKSQADKGLFYVSDFISQLQELSGKSFSNFLQLSYKEIFDISKEVFMAISSLAGFDLERIVNLIFGTSKILVDLNNQRNDPVDILVSYIKKISESAHLVIVLDHFSRCDEDSFAIVVRTLERCLDLRNVSFVIVTVGNEVLENDRIRILLTERLAHEYLLVDRFRDPVPFRQILEHSISYDGSLTDLASTLHDICKGNPSELKKLMARLYCENKFTWNQDQGKYVLSETAITDYLSDLYHSEKTGWEGFRWDQRESFLLQFVAMLGIAASQNALINMAAFCARELGFYNFEIPALHFSFGNLKALGLLDQSDGKVFLSNAIASPSIKKLILDSVPQHLVAEHICEFVYQNTQLFDESTRLYLLSRHAFLARFPKWPELNAEAALHFYSRGNRTLLQEILERICTACVKDDLSETHWIRMAEAAFDSGLYTQALLMIENNTNKDHLPKRDRYRAYLLEGRCHHIAMNPHEAIPCFERALLCGSNDEERLDAQNMVMSALRASEKQADKERASRIFDQILDAASASGRDYLSCHRALRNCLYYVDEIKAMHIYRDEILSTQKRGNVVEEAFCRNNRGFVSVRLNDLSSAETDFRDARNLLSNIKPHETAYCLNNLGVCRMLSGDYKAALAYFGEANFWARSPYVLTGIKINTMMSYFNLKMKESYEVIAQELSEAITQPKKGTDALVRSRILVNLALIYIDEGNEDRALSCLDAMPTPGKGALSEYRVAVLQKKLTGNDNPLPNPKLNTPYYTSCRQEVFLISYSHD